jgi:Flp pilus assembly protein TadB
MLLIVLSICVGSFAAAVLVATIFGKGASKRGTSRLAALDHEFAPTDDEEEKSPIFGKQHRRLSAIPWLNHWLTELNLAPVSSLYLYQAGVTLTLGTLVLTSIAGFAFLGYILLRFGAALPALLLAAGFLPLPFLYVRHRRAKRLSKLEQQLPEALGMMVSALRVGHSLIASLGAVAQDCRMSRSAEKSASVSRNRTTASTCAPRS